jgi:parallel beta-helix repeat protein
MLLKRIRALRMISFLILLSLLITSFSLQATGDGTGDYPPPIDEEWVISQDTYIHGETITVDHNITITNGTTLTLDNTTLILNAPDYGDLWISVKEGGELNIINNSKLMEGETKVNYEFIYEDGSSGTISDSDIANCGWDDGGTFLSSGGILIASDNVTVANSSIHNNYIGFVIFASSPKIENNDIHDNLKYGIILINGSSEIKGNDISLNPIGIYSLYSSPKLKDNIIRDNGDGARIYYSEFSLEGDRFSSNSPDDCTTGTCSAQESGKGFYLEGSILNAIDVEFSDNSRSLISYYSNLSIHGSTFSGSSLDGIYAEYSQGDLTNNSFLNNYRYGIKWMYSELDLDPSNSFTENTGEARMVLEWDVVVNVKDANGDWVPNADMTFEGEGKSYSATTTILGMGIKAIAEYVITNDGTKVNYNPYTITASKTASWDGITYQNSTTKEITNNTQFDLIIPLKKSDLVIDDITFSETPKVNNKVKIKIKISNTGEAAANNVTLIVTQKDPSGKTSIVNKTTFSIGPGHDMTLNIPWTPGEDGDTTVFAEVDNTKNIKELDEDNNELEKSVDVAQKDAPLFEDSFFMAGLITFLIILAGVGIYILTFRKKVEDLRKGEDPEKVDDPENIEGQEKEE